MMKRLGVGRSPPPSKAGPAFSSRRHAMHLLSFLGTGAYQPVAYALDGETAAPTPYAAVAIAQLAGARSATILATIEAEEKHGAVLGDALARTGVQARIARIPSGARPEEHWEIFDAVAEAARGRDSVALDVTHGFRTQPLLGFLSAAFLRATGAAPLDRLLYGAFEAKDAATGVAPVFDLTPFLALLDWTAAADQFLATGSAARLADLLEDTHQSLWRQADPGARESLPRNLKNLGKSLRTTTSGLLLLRRASRAANLAELGAALERSRDEVARYAPPFATLLDRVLAGTAALRAAADDELAAERAQIEWLLDHGRTDAALTLAREWLVSLVAARIRPGLPIPDDYAGRKPFETFLNVLAGHPRLSGADVDDGLRPVLADPSFAAVGAAWNQISALRNDLNHAGYNRNSKPEAVFARDATAAVREAVGLSLPALP